MPYKSTKQLPPGVKKKSPKKQRQFREVFNSVYDKTGSDRAASKAAWAAIKKKK